MKDFHGRTQVLQMTSQRLHNSLSQMDIQMPSTPSHLNIVVEYLLCGHTFMTPGMKGVQMRDDLEKVLGLCESQ